MLDLATLNKFDSQGMFKIYDKWSEIAKESYEKKTKTANFEDIDNIIFVGMGGSGTIGDVFSAILSRKKIHISIVKGYSLPKTIDAKTLVVFTSITGNTSETLYVLDLARKLGTKTISFSNGGMMKEFCNKNNLEYRNIDAFHSPRASFTSFLYSMISILDSIFPITKIEVRESLTQLDELCKQISSSNLTETNPALSLAHWISSMPLIYHPWGLQAAAIRFKNSLQENAKIHAMTENVIETCHNGIVAWEKPSNVKPILLQGIDDHVKTKERWRILKEYFHANNIECREVISVKGNILSKLINLIYLLDFSTIYLAALSKIDPSPIESIDFIKKRL